MENTEKEKRFVILGKTSNGGGGGGGEGTVTSVGISVPTGLNVIGSPVTSSGIIQIGFANGYSIPTTAKQAEWDAKSDFSGSYNDLTNKPTLATVATTGSYNDLSNKPTIPSKTSDLTNDSGYVIGTSLSSVATSGDYDDLTNKPTIPTKTSDLTNDSGFLTSHQSIKTINNQSMVGTGNITVSTFSGSYNDLTDKPTIPTVGNGTITITQGGVTKGTFTTNQSGDSTITLDAGGGGGTQVQSDWSETDTTSMAYILHKPTLSTVATTGDYDDLTNKPTIPTNTSDLTNDSGFISQIKTINNESLIGTGNLTIDTFSGDYNDLTNKPTIPTKTSDLTNDSNFVVSSTLATVATTGDYDDLTNKPTIPTVGNGTITITQGGVTKGTFTTNQSGNSTIALDAGGSGGGDVTAAGNNTFTGINSFMNDVFIGGYEGDEGGSIAEENYSLFINSVNGSTYIGINQLSMSDNVNNSFSLYLSSESTYIQTDNLNIIPSTEGETPSVSINGNQVLTTNDVATVATTGSYNDLTNRPTLATVATSGSYNDLTNRPTIPAAQVNSDWNASSGVSQILNKPSMSTETLTFIDDNNVSTTVVVYTQPTV